MRQTNHIRPNDDKERLGDMFDLLIRRQECKKKKLKRFCMMQSTFLCLLAIVSATSFRKTASIVPGEDSIPWWRFTGDIGPINVPHGLNGRSLIEPILEVTPLQWGDGKCARRPATWGRGITNEVQQWTELSQTGSGKIGRTKNF